ncbi:MAG: hypothetical protein H7Z14_03280 [Anaerolineae bacterium]|nr:hypothetical protein [Phycisphaerae bacterium]
MPLLGVGSVSMVDWYTQNLEGVDGKMIERGPKFPAQAQYEAARRAATRASD